MIAKYDVLEDAFYLGSAHIAMLVAVLVILASSTKVHSVEIWKRSFILTPTEVLIEEGDKFGANIVKSPLSPLLSNLADEHAQEVCRGIAPHNGFHNRVLRAVKGKGSEISEIVARSWSGRTLHEGAAEAWRDWKTSRNHWRTANGNRKHTVPH